MAAHRAGERGALPGSRRETQRQEHNWRVHSLPIPVRNIILLLLTLASCTAVAGWVEVGGNETATTYADSGTIRRSGTTVKMWHLLDYEIARRIEGIRPYLSIKMLDEYDCAQQRTRTLSILLHAANMGAGEVLGSVNDPGDWRPVLPDTLVQTLREFACGKW